MPEMGSSAVRVLLLASLGSVAAYCHYTWVAPVDNLEIGKASTVRISHGDRFPVSEEAINAAQVDVYVLAPSGAKTKLAATKGTGFVSAPFEPKEAGPHRIVLVQDRGITSRTPKGAKPGGRDRNPDAISASRTFRTAVSYVSTNGAATAKGGKPVGLELEMIGEWSGSGWQVQLLKTGKPMGGVSVEVFLASSGSAAATLKTGADGKIMFQPPAGAKGPALFSAMFKDPAPSGAAYDAVNYETSLYVTW